MASLHHVRAGDRRASALPEVQEALSRQCLACHSSSRLSQTYVAVLIDHKPSMIDSAVHGWVHRSPAENHPPLHGPPIGDLVELPAQVTGSLIGRSTLVHALSLQTAPGSEHPLSAPLRAAPRLPQSGTRCVHPRPAASAYRPRTSAPQAHIATLTAGLPARPSPPRRASPQPVKDQGR